jgi:hypothetical protein
LCEAKQRETGLGHPRVVVRGEKRLLGADEIPDAEPDVAQFGQRPTELAPHPRAEFVAGGERLLLGPVAGSGEPKHLRTVNPAPSAEPPERSPFSPVLHRLGPFSCPLVEREPLHSADDFAIDHPRCHGIDVARCQCERDVVEHLDAFVDVSIEDPESGHGRPPHQHGGLHAESLAEVDGPHGVDPCGHHVAAPQPFVGTYHGHDRMDRGLVVFGDQSIGPAEPPPDRCHQSGVDHQVHGDHDGCPCRAEVVTVRDVQRVELFPRRHGSFGVSIDVGSLRHRLELGSPSFELGACFDRHPAEPWYCRRQRWLGTGRRIVPL